MKKKLLVFAILLFLIGTSIGGYAYWIKNLPLVSPGALLENMFPIQKPSGNKIVYGFLPYWNLKYADKLHINELTHLAYFALDLNPDGTAHTHVNKKELEPGWNKLKSPELYRVMSQIKLLGKKNVLTVTAMDIDGIEELLGSKENSQKAIESIITVFKDYHFDSLNIDFEHIGAPPETIRQNFTSFISSVRSACIAVKPTCQIDIDIFGDTLEKRRLHDIKSLAPYTDHFIIMAYDYYRKSSSQAGPVAPIRGKCDGKSFSSTCLDQDVTTHLSQVLNIIPPDKVVLGVPFYGYEWQTASANYMANTYKGTGSLATYARIKSLWENPDVSSISAQWSDETLAPWLSYYEDDNIYQIQYEDANSLTQKVKLIKTTGLAGIGIWALGYETPHLDLWEPIKALKEP